MSSQAVSYTVAVGADHRGIDLKRKMIEYLRQNGMRAEDLGSFGSDPVDYPDVAFPLAQSVAAGKYERGILICMSGAGMAMCANKVDGIRAALCINPEQAKLSREHNDSNVLVLGSKFITADEACAIALQWLGTPFEGGRHEKRVQKITDFERGR